MLHFYYEATAEPDVMSDVPYVGWWEKELDCCSVFPLFSDESKCWVCVCRCLESSVKFQQSIIIWCAMSSRSIDRYFIAPTREICWCWCTVFYQVYPTGDFSALSCLHLLTSFMSMQISSPQWQNYYQRICWLGYYCAWLANKLNRPEPHNLWAKGHCQSSLDFNNSLALPQADGHNPKKQ